MGHVERRRLFRRFGTLNIVLVIVLLVAAVVGYLLLRSPGEAQAAGSTSTVQRGTVEATVSASGTTESATTSDVSFAATGTVESISVDVGDVVHRGQVLAQLDPTGAQAGLQTAEASATSASAGVTSALAGVTAARSGSVAAQANLNAAQMDLQALKASGTATRQQIADAEAKVASARSQVAQSQASVTSADGQVSEAEAQVTSAHAQVTQAQETLSDTVLRAPIGGTVVEVNGSVGQAAGSGSSGSSTTSGTSGFVVISKLKDLQVSANFSETDAAKLKVGQQATVTFDALGTSAPGVVRWIDPTSTTDNNVVEYGVELQLKGQVSGLRAGQTATVQVVVDRANDALYVPSAAVQTSAGQQVVTVERNGQQTLVAVTVGVEGDQTTQIVSGLSEGERVVIPSSTGSNGFPGGGFPGGGGFAISGGGPGGARG